MDSESYYPDGIFNLNTIYPQELNGFKALNKATGEIIANGPEPDDGVMIINNFYDTSILLRPDYRGME
ncbi:MAG: hypothetical protein HZA78_06730 [Candidatus Schekmanbacteria bacterium]|nr:hypothetical protein [Candidatus Schekmanbacteria bacterium]